MKLSTKLNGAFGSTVLIGMLAAGAGAWYVGLLGAELREATERTAVKLDLVNAARARAWESIAALRGASLSAKSGDRLQFEASAKRLDAAVRRMGEQVRQLKPLFSTDGDLRDLATFESGLAEFQGVSSESVSFLREGKFESSDALAPEAQAFTTLSDTTLNSLKDRQRKVLSDAQSHASALRGQSLIVNLSACVALLLIGALAARIVRGVCRTVLATVASLSSSADQVAAAASQVSVASQSLAQGASQHAASLQETSAAVEEVRAVARNNSSKSKAAAEAAAASGLKCIEVDHSLAEAVAAVGDIHTQSGHISKIIQTIDEIAFQTNILALNASVEAARAGDAGLGFAVVAAEVRTLAHRCAQAAQDTTALIEESIRKSDAGKDRVDRVTSAIQLITTETGKLKTLVDAVDADSRNQTRGIEQIASSVVQMQRVTQTTAASAEESAAAAQELDAQATTAQEIVRDLAQMIGVGKQAEEPRQTNLRPYV